MSISAARSLAQVPRQARAHGANPILHVEGLVHRPLALAPADLAALPRVPFAGQLSCLEAGPIPVTDWLGIPLAAVIALAGPRPEARFVRVSAGPYATPVALADASEALLCDRLSGQPLALEQGGPWRLVIPGSRYYTSVKWVDRLVLSADPPDNSAQRIADARARARAARGSTPCGSE
ncbi:MAG: molybdopterin-dependent oxidoreductase [Thermomicrobiales bacterium]|nr:molybdopterin-dependent oxidoreductase [Thermomicrobiales bacterium]